MLITVATRPNIFSSPSQLPFLAEADLGCSLSELTNLDWRKSRKFINWLLRYDVL